MKAVLTGALLMTMLVGTLALPGASACAVQAGDPLGAEACGFAALDSAKAFAASQFTAANATAHQALPAAP